MLSNHLILCYPLLLLLQSSPVSWLFSSGGQSIGASALVLPMNIQGWFLLELTGLISLQSKGLSRVFPNTTVQKHKIFSAQPSLYPTLHIHLYIQFRSVQSLSHVRLFVTPWIAARQASLSITNLMDMSLSKLWEMVKRQGSLACCIPWVHKKSDMTKRLNKSNKKKSALIYLRATPMFKSQMNWKVIYQCLMLIISTSCQKKSFIS